MLLLSIDLISFVFVAENIIREIKFLLNFFYAFFIKNVEVFFFTPQHLF